MKSKVPPRQWILMLAAVLIPAACPQAALPPGFSALGSAFNDQSDWVVKGGEITSHPGECEPALFSILSLRPIHNIEPGGDMPALGSYRGKYLAKTLSTAFDQNRWDMARYILELSATNKENSK